MTDIAPVLVEAIFFGVGVLMWSLQRPIPGDVVTSGVIVDRRPCCPPDAGGDVANAHPGGFSRRISVTLRMGNFLLGTPVLPRMTTVDVVIQEGRVPASVDQGAAPSR